MSPEASKPETPTQAGSDQFVEGFHPTDGVRPFKQGDLPDVHDEMLERGVPDTIPIDPHTLETPVDKIPLETEITATEDTLVEQAPLQTPEAPVEATPTTTEKKSNWKRWVAGLVGSAVLAGGGVAATKGFGGESDSDQPSVQPSAGATPTPGETAAPNPGENEPTSSPEASTYGETMPTELQTYAELAPSEFAALPIEERLQFTDWLNRDLEKMAGLRADNLVGPEYDIVEPSETNTGQQILDRHYATIQSAFLDHDLSESGNGTLIDKDAAAKLIYALHDGDAPTVQNVVTTHIETDLNAMDELHTLNVDVSLISEQSVTEEVNEQGETIYHKQIEIIDNNFGDTATIEFALTPYTDALGNEKQAWVRVQ